MKRCLILVEGQTEERFVKDVLTPHSAPFGLHLEVTILVTKVVKDGPNFRGGVSTFGKIEADLRRLLRSAGGALVTTILDYYRLPLDTPGLGDRPIGTPWDRVSHVERRIAEHFGTPDDFLPFLALHEFEAWLFASDDELPRAIPALTLQPQFAAIRQGYRTPEEINERPDQSPSKRIQALFPAFQKNLHGPMVASRIGVAGMRRECPHLNEWLETLESFAQP